MAHDHDHEVAVAGWISGVAGLAVGHPFDTLKVRMQSESYKGSMGMRYVVTSLQREAGLSGFYRGFLPPAACSAAINSLLFYSQHICIKYILHVPEGAGLTATQHFWSGCFAGFAVSFISCPMEFLKIRLQLLSQVPLLAASKLREPSRTVAKDTRHPLVKLMVREYKSRGVLGFYQGFGVTLVREVPGYGIYFWSYQVTKDWLDKKFPSKSADDLRVLPTLLAGGIAGVLGNIFVPSDMVKTRVQEDFERRPARYWIQHILSHECPRGLWRGFVATLLRGFPLNAATFVTYELLLKIFARFHSSQASMAA
jgi:solute carrier family 25 carnitine/acylcarnitine transporter 20/29